jgi:hypothetical protein
LTVSIEFRIESKHFCDYKRREKGRNLMLNHIFESTESELLEVNIKIMLLWPIPLTPNDPIFSNLLIQNL